MLHPPYEADGHADDYRLYFDLSKRSFERSSAATPPSRWLPLHVVLDAEQLLGWVESHLEGPERPMLLKAALGLNKALREYQIPTYVVQTDDERLLRDIFDRLNTGGLALKAQDIFHALHGGMTASEPTDLHALALALDTQGLGHLDERWILRAILAIEGLDVTRVKSAQRQIAANDQLLPRAERALRSVSVFLSREARIPLLDLLPYGFPVIVLAKFFDRHPEPNPRSRQLLARWLWRGATAETYRSALPAILREQLSAIDEKIDEEESVQRLLRLLPMTQPVPVRLGQRFSFRAAQTKIEIGLLAALEPREFGSGKPLPAAKLIEQDRAGALRDLWPRGPRTLATRIIYPPEPGSADLVAAIVHEADPKVLNSHAISEDARLSLRRGDLADFVARRTTELLGRLERLLEIRTHRGESDRKSIAALVVEDEARSGV